MRTDFAPGVVEVVARTLRRYTNPGSLAWESVPEQTRDLWRGRAKQTMEVENIE